MEDKKSKRLLDNKYEIIKKLGIGSFGKVYLAQNIQDKKYYAVKVERVFQTEKERRKNVINSPIFVEFIVYCMTNKVPDISVPRVYEFKRGKKRDPGDEYVVEKNGTNEKPDDPDNKVVCTFNQYLVMDVMGPNLSSLQRKKPFTMDQICDMACQMLTILEKVHKIGYVHRDIKPENFTLGIENIEGSKFRITNKVYLLDFGLAKRWDKEIYKYADNEGSPSGSMVGTARYMSINVHNGMPYGRRDDLESLGYILIFFAKNALPWQGLKIKEKKKHLAKIRDLKDSSKKTICEALPKMFEKYMEYCWNLTILDDPNYDYLRKLFVVKA